MNIPCENMEIEQIYTQLLSNPHTSIAICAAQEGEGVTSLAFALAERNLLAGHSTLLVDLNLYHPSLQSLLSLDTEKLQRQPENQHSDSTELQNNNHRNNLPTMSDVFSAPQLVFSDKRAIVINGITAPTKREHTMKIRQPGVLEKCIDDWLKQFDTVIIDTSPLNRINAQNIPPERVAAACDGAILVVMAGKTSEAAINNATAKLNNANALLLGSVFNDRDNPTLKSELLREVQKLDPRFSWLSRPLKRILHKSRLLALQV